MKISDQIALMADILPAVAQIGEFLIMVGICYLVGIRVGLFVRNLLAEKINTAGIPLDGFSIEDVKGLLTQREYVVSETSENSFAAYRPVNGKVYPANYSIRDDRLYGQVTDACPPYMCEELLLHVYNEAVYRKSNEDDITNFFDLEERNDYVICKKYKVKSTICIIIGVICIVGAVLTGIWADQYYSQLDIRLRQALEDTFL